MAGNSHDVPQLKVKSDCRKWSWRSDASARAPISVNINADCDTADENEGVLALRPIGVFNEHIGKQKGNQRQIGNGGFGEKLLHRHIRTQQDQTRPSEANTILYAKGLMFDDGSRPSSFRPNGSNWRSFLAFGRNPYRG